MHKIGTDVFFLVEQNNGDVTLENGKLISHDNYGVCVLTYIGCTGKGIKFLPRDCVFDDVEDGEEAYSKYHGEIEEIKRATKRIHISCFEEKS